MLRRVIEIPPRHEGLAFAGASRQRTTVICRNLATRVYGKLRRRDFGRSFSKGFMILEKFLKPPKMKALRIFRAVPTPVNDRTTGRRGKR